MPFFLLFFLLNIIVYANTISIVDTFKNLNRVCIYNKTNTKLDLDLKIDYYRDVCMHFFASDYDDSNCSTKEVTLSPDGLRENVIYYVVELWGENEDDEYNLTIKGDDDLIASECPSSHLAKVANTSANNIAAAATFAGVVVGLIFFSAFVYAITPGNKNDYEEG